MYYTENFCNFLIEREHIYVYVCRYICMYVLRRIDKSSCRHLNICFRYEAVMPYSHTLIYYKECASHVTQRTKSCIETITWPHKLHILSRYALTCWYVVLVYYLVHIRIYICMYPYVSKHVCMSVFIELELTALFGVMLSCGVYCLVLWLNASSTSISLLLANTRQWSGKLFCWLCFSVGLFMCICV